MKTMRLKRMIAVTALATAGLLSAGTSANAAPAGGQTAAAQFRCGFYVGDDLTAYYGHCDAPPRTDIVIHVEGSSDYDMCVKPGVTRLGKWPTVSYAAYTGRLCSAG
ncbi:DUF6355 family natural product biosynthesis protein [Streptomyces chartreusis]|uniref:DUF6355 family natural product biosynthesis protein n=1 Tax=Streptomyces chartreusis TaxID=1969 RepID=UPI0036A0E69E